MKNSYRENLLRFERFCPEAAKQLPHIECAHLQFCETEQGELNLINSTASPPLYYHSQKGALEEARNWFEKTFPIGVRVICVYGIGLGYYYDALKDWLKSNSSRFLVFIEDDLCVIKRFLETDKAEEMLKNTQVILQYFETPGEKDWGKFRKNFEWFFSGFGQSPTCYEALGLYKNIKENMFHLVKQQMIINQIDFKWSLDELFVYQELVSRNFYHNLPYLSDAGIGKALEEQFPNVPALICGAGPSLNKHFEILKQIKDKAIIFGSGTAMNILTRNGIMPHFGFCIDPYDIQESRFMTNLAYEVPFFYTNRFFHKASRIIHGPRLFISMGHGFIEQWFKKEIGLPITNYRAGGISTTNACCNLSGLLGCNPIILTGLDLAYTDSSRYAEGVSRHPSEQKTDEQEPAHLVEAVGIHGKNVQSRWDWLVEASFYTEFAQIRPSVSVINATEGGLGIMEIPNLSLEDVVNKRLVYTYDIQNWIHCEIQESRKNSIDKEKLISSIDKWRTSLENSKQCCEQILDLIKAMSSDAGENDPTPVLKNDERTAPLIKELKEEPVFEFLLGPNEYFFLSLAAVDINKLYLYPDQFSQKQKVLIHFNMEKGRYNFFKNMIEIHQASLNEGLNDFHKHSLNEQAAEAASRPEIAPAKDRYEFADGLFAIEDCELGIHIDEKFYPKFLSKEQKENKEYWGRGLLSPQPGKLEGQVLLIYPSGAIKGEFFYKEGQIHGPSTFYDSDGLILAKSWFLNGRRIGKSCQYYLDGNIYSIQRYDQNGNLHGLQEYYYPTGIKKTIFNYANGLLEGELKLYYPSGRIKREQHLTQGKLNGKESVWSPDGKLILQSEFKMNLPTGKTTMWHSNGQMAKEIIFYDDPRNFNLLMWDEEGRIIRRQTSLPENLFQDMIKKSTELQKAIDDAVGKLADLKKQSEDNKS